MADNIAGGEGAIILAGLGAVHSFILVAATYAVLVNHSRRQQRQSEYALPLLLKEILLLCFGFLGANLSLIEGLFVLRRLLHQ